MTLRLQLNRDQTTKAEVENPSDPTTFIRHCQVRMILIIFETKKGLDNTNNRRGRCIVSHTGHNCGFFIPNSVPKKVALKFPAHLSLSHTQDTVIGNGANVVVGGDAS